MRTGDIAFPHLGIYLENVPKTFSVFGFPVAFYGLIIAAGMAAGFWLVLREAGRTGQDKDCYWEFALYALIFSIIGARLYYVAFSWETYKDDLLSVFHVREGGMAIYGSVAAAFLTLAVYSRVRKKSFFSMADTIVPGLALGQSIGRWGNFVNREAFGTYTDSLFAMRLPLEAVRAGEVTEEIAARILPGANFIQVHPAFLYEAAWNLALLVLLLLLGRRKAFPGEVCLLYLGGYGLGRFLIEGLRTDQLLVPGTSLPVSQALGAFFIFFSVARDWWGRRKTRYGGEKKRGHNM